MTHVLAVGGILEREGSLDRLAEATCKTFNVEQGESILFRKAMGNEERLRELCEDAFLVTHSAGILAVHAALRTANANEMPNRYLALNGPEPTGIPELAVRGVIKTGKHIGRILTGPLREEQLGTLADGVYEFGLHFLGNFRHLPDISKFSTTDSAIELHDRGLADSTVGIASKDDYWLPPRYNRARMEAAGVKVRVYDGRHDDPLIRPNKVLAKITA